MKIRRYTRNSVVNSIFTISEVCGIWNWIYDAFHDIKFV